MKNIDTLIVVIVFVVSVIAGFFALNDLSLSEAIVNQQSEWAGLLEQYGEMPGAVVIIFGILIFSIQFKSSSAFKYASTQILLVLTLSLILLYISFIFISIFSGSSNSFFYYTPFLLIVFFVLGAAAILFFRNQDLNFSPRLILISKIILGMALFGYVLSNQIIKILWGRIRYRDLDILNSNFTEWYIANGLNGNQSFPSGHAAMAWMLLPLFLLFLNKNCLIKSITLGLILILAMSIAVSRVVIGAHYPSDVLFGSFFMIISFLVLYKRYIKNNQF